MSKIILDCFDLVLLLAVLCPEVENGEPGFY